MESVFRKSALTQSFFKEILKLSKQPDLRSAVFTFALACAILRSAFASLHLKESIHLYLGQGLQEWTK